MVNLSLFGTGNLTINTGCDLILCGILCSVVEVLEINILKVSVADSRYTEYIQYCRSQNSGAMSDSCLIYNYSHDSVSVLCHLLKGKSSAYVKYLMFV